MIMHEKAKLRVGIMCPGKRLPHWQVLCIQNLVATRHVDLNLLILDDKKNYPSRTIVNKVLKTKFSRLFFAVYSKTLFRPSSMVIKDASDLLNGVPAISCVVNKKGKYSQYFSENDIQIIREYDLDIILRFGFNIIRGEILTTARYGVWSFHHDDELKYRGAPPCFWEIYKHDPETGAVLQKLTDKLDGGVVLKKGIFRTKNYSYSRNVDQAYYESARWPAWVCNDIVAGHGGYIAGHSSITAAPIYRYPGNGQFLKFMFIVSFNLLRNLVFRLFIMQRWNVALIHGNIGALAHHSKELPRHFLNHKNRNSFNADCFGIATDTGVAVLFEELDYSGSGRGKIAASLFDNDGKEVTRAYPDGLNLQGHASYPFIFIDGDTYLIPETGNDNRIALYRAQKFPMQWKWERDLLTGQHYSDATLLKYDNYYWMFYTIHSREFDGDLHLHVAYSKNLREEFREHPSNPVKISARSARPAGTPFFDQQGDLIRPAQNFCKTYGGSIVLNKITKLSTTEFREEEIGEIKPFDPYYKHGVHTVARVSEHFTLVDMKRHVFKLHWLFLKKG